MTRRADGTGAVRPDDRADVLDVVASSGLFAPDELVEVAATLDTHLAGSDPAGCWSVSRSNGAATAVAYYAPERMTNGTWNVYLLAVHGERQGRGSGSALVRWVEQDLGERGARLLLIETSGTAGFARQRAFYTRLGYVEEARVRDFYDAGDDKVVFWKPLVRAIGGANAPGSGLTRLP